MKKGGSKAFKQRSRVAKQRGAVLMRPNGSFVVIAESGSKIPGFGRLDFGIRIATISKEDTK